MSNAELLATGSPVPMYQEFAPQPAEDERLSLRQRAMGTLGKFATRAGAVVAAVGLSLGLAQPAEASSGPSCYGDYCTGQYPDETGCDEDADTLSTQPLMASVSDVEASTADGFFTSTHRAEIGTLEVRGSERCGTVWTRVTLHVPAHIKSVSAIQDETGHTQTHVAQRDNGMDAVTGTFFSKQIYTHNFRTQGWVDIHGVKEEDQYTKWVEGLRPN